VRRNNGSSGKDNFETCEIFLESVDKALETIKTEGVKVGNLVYPIKIIHVYDLAAFWEITTITKFECPYGKDCRQHYRTNTQRARSSNMRPKNQVLKLLKKWDQTIPAKGLFLKSIDDLSFAFCIKMRVVNLMMNIMLDRLLIEKNKLEQLEKVMASLDLPFEVYTPEKGQRKGKKRVRSYNGKQADFILHNIKKIISIWPTFLLPPFHEYTDVELCNAAQRNNVSVTQRVMIEKVKTVSQLKEGLAGKNVKNVSNLRKESLLEIAEKHGIETTILEPISQPKPRAILEEELREKLSAKKIRNTEGDGQ